MINENVRALIQRRRMQLLVHSAIYYAYNESIVSDEQWKNWALELEQLQKEHPSEAAAAPYAEAFKNFDHSTGYDLPYRDPAILARAVWLLRIHDQRRIT
nr:MAG TPA: NAD-dependent DNA ligase (contains BRCT domain type II) [Caudoviricetes sp.]